MSDQGHWYKDGPPPVDEGSLELPKSNGLGIAGFVLSVVGLCGTGGLLSPIGFLLSFIALFKQPRGWAVAGTIVGAIGTCAFFPFGLLFVLLATGAVTVSAFIIWIGNTMSLPPEAKTALHAMVITTIISTNYGVTQTLPQSLDELDLEAPILVDGWGNPFVYELTDTGGFILMSPGGDGAADTGDDIVLEGVKAGSSMTVVPNARTPRTGAGPGTGAAPGNGPDAGSGAAGQPPLVPSGTP